MQAHIIEYHLIAKNGKIPTNEHETRIDKKRLLLFFIFIRNRIIAMNFRSLTDIGFYCC